MCILSAPFHFVECSTYCYLEFKAKLVSAHNALYKTKLILLKKEDNNDKKELFK